MPLAYRVCAALLNRLPVDSTGRRVLDETLADWRRELRTYRGLGAVIRAVVGVAAGEVVSQAMCRAWLRTAAWSTAWVLLSLGLSRIAYGWSGLSAYKIAAFSVTGSVFFLPTAILLSSLHRKGRLPIIGLCLTSALTGSLLIGWASPAANRVVFHRFVDVPMVQQPASTNTQSLFRTIWPPQPPEQMTGWFVHDLPALVADGPPNGWVGIQLISFNAAFVSLCGLTPLLASALSRSSVWTGRTAIVLSMMFVLYRVRIAELVSPDWILWSFVAPWLSVMIVASGLIIGGAARPEPVAHKASRS